ncbi:ATP-binding protein [Brachyspira pilosicoli]|uniref:AAA family ATPase n=1 Tax=Brachyspira pilosicoli TaxID=52584 RepID=UPI0025429C89|nr:AAA family ATPase [Brachyspira pilosicoli]WIH83501.1 ATP-binding protein [Brachyspira pilosicoli]
MLEVKKYPTLYVKNFAKIKEAEIELAPFTLFVGDNNSGKSYLASLVWYISSVMFFWDYKKSLKFKNYHYLYSLANEIFSNNKTEVTEIKISNEVIKDCIDIANDIISYNKVSIFESIFTYKNIIAEEIYISYQNYDININIKYHKSISSNKSNDNIIYFYHNNKYFPGNASNSLDSIITLLCIRILESIMSREYDNTLFLPVSRTGFLLFKDLIIDKSLNSYFSNSYYSNINDKLELTLPIQSFFSKLSDLRFNEYINKKYIVDLLENEIINGSIYLDNMPFPQVHYKSNNSDIDLKMHVSSAVITEIAILILFLKYSKQNEDIIMEEPEISLHPYFQQQLTRVFIKLVNSNTNVLITTHSDTIVQHINNMIKLNSNEEERKKYLMNKYGYDEDDLISKDKVRMYQFDINKKDGFTKVTKLKSSEYGFEVPTFNKILKKMSDEIYDFQEEL